MTKNDTFAKTMKETGHINIHAKNIPDIIEYKIN